MGRAGAAQRNAPRRAAVATGAGVAWRPSPHELLDAIPDPVIGCHASGRVAYWSAAAGREYGYEPQEALGRDCLELLQTRLPKPLIEILEEVADLGAWSGQLVHRAQDGSPRRVGARWVARRGERGAVVGTVRIERPLRGGDEMSSEIDSAAPRARPNHEDELRVVPSRIAHDLNNALAIVVNYSALLGSDLERLGRRAGDERLSAVRRDLREVQAAADRASSLVAGVLDPRRAAPAAEREPGPRASAAARKPGRQAPPGAPAAA